MFKSTEFIGVKKLRIFTFCAMHMNKKGKHERNTPLYALLFEKNR